MEKGQVAGCVVTSSTTDNVRLTTKGGALGDTDSFDVVGEEDEVDAACPFFTSL